MFVLTFKCAHFILWVIVEQSVEDCRQCVHSSFSSDSPVYSHTVEIPLSVETWQQGLWAEDWWLVFSIFLKLTVKIWWRPWPRQRYTTLTASLI